MSAIYVVTGSKGMTVRDGMEANSQEIMILHPGEWKIEEKEIERDFGNVS